jgi:hypothetical protein
MEQREFVEAEPGSWWFIDPGNDSAWYEARRALVEPKGWQEPSWLEDQSKLLELYKDLEARGPQLLKDLDDLYDDDSKIRWIASVQEVLAPLVEEHKPEPEMGPEAEPAVVEMPQAREDPPAESEAPKKKGLFAKKREEAQPEPELQGQAAAEVPAHVTAGVTKIFEALSGEAGAALADELGISEDHLAELANDPEFEQMVHEEAARLLQANG